MNTPRDRQNVEAVLQVSVKANDELYREIRRDANMCDALRELMKDDLEDARKLGESEGEVRGEARGKVKSHGRSCRRSKNEPQRNVAGKHCIHHRQGSG